MANAPYMYWVGMNTPPDASPEEIAQFNEFYSNVHMHEVVESNPGFIRGTRYELLQPDPRGNLGPRWLCVYEMEDEAAADRYANRRPEDGPKYTPGPDAFKNNQGWWRLIWHRLVPRDGELGANGAPYLYFVAMNVPADTDAAGLKAFNEFYTHTHVPEVVGISRFLSGIRYELKTELRHPAPGAPRFLAVYEANDDSLKAREAIAANPGSVRLSSGPPTWEAHDTLWRLLYRRMDTYARP